MQGFCALRCARWVLRHRQVDASEEFRFLPTLLDGRGVLSRYELLTAVVIRFMHVKHDRICHK